MIISIIGGTEPQGIGIAKRLALEGFNVIIGSENKQEALDTITHIKDLCRYNLSNMNGMSNKQAAKNGDILIITAPLTTQKATIEKIKDYCENKIIIDTTVPLETSITGKPTRFVNLMEGSAAERTASILKDTGAKVICAFCNISPTHLENIPEEINCDCLIAGDDANSKQIVSEIINEIPGIRTIDCGKLEKSRIIEKITPLLIGLKNNYNSKYIGFRITGIDI